MIKEHISDKTLYQCQITFGIFSLIFSIGIISGLLPYEMLSYNLPLVLWR